MLDKILEILDKIGPILYIVIPAIAGIWYKLKTELDKKKTQVKNINLNKAKELYNLWEHEESKVVINKIKDLCNFYKDKGHSDLVQYLQLENGTAATSKIQNMFMTCLAEDDRYGSIPKMIKRLQRMPYSETVCWLNKLAQMTSEGESFLETPDISTAEYSRTYIEGISGIGSVIVAPVFDPNETLLGICVFYYHGRDYNGQLEAEKMFMTKFRSSIESTILDYHIHRNLKKKELGLEDEQ